VSLLHYFADCGSVKKGLDCLSRIVRVTPELLALFPNLKTCGKCLRRRAESVDMREMSALLASSTPSKQASAAME